MGEGRGASDEPSEDGRKSYHPIQQQGSGRFQGAVVVRVGGGKRLKRMDERGRRNHQSERVNISRLHLIENHSFCLLALA